MRLYEVRLERTVVESRNVPVFAETEGEAKRRAKEIALELGLDLYPGMKGGIEVGRCRELPETGAYAEGSRIEAEGLERQLGLV